jgi:hypothetical protein
VPHVDATAVDEFRDPPAPMGGVTVDQGLHAFRDHASEQEGGGFVDFADVLLMLGGIRLGERREGVRTERHLAHLTGGGVYRVVLHELWTKELSQILRRRFSATIRVALRSHTTVDMVR